MSGLGWTGGRNAQRPTLPTGHTPALSQQGRLSPRNFLRGHSSANIQHRTQLAAAGNNGGGSDMPQAAAPAAAASLDVDSYNAQRLALDQQAMDAMRQQCQAESDAQAAAPEAAPPGAWKWEIRKQVWDYLEANDLADFPRPVHHRIPNFKGAAEAAARLAALPEFQAAQCIKVNPDTPQKQVRLAALSSGKTLLTPQPRLRTGFFSSLHRDSIPANALAEACTSAGVVKYGKPLSLDDKVKVDLIVVGSVAVDPETGCRLGKGEGFAELEYGTLRWMGAIDDSTLVVTTVRDEQVLSGGRIPREKMLKHDVPVDIIVTPTQVIRVPSEGKPPKPPGILWDRLSPQKLAQIRILQQLKRRIEEEQGFPLPCGPDEVLPPVAERRQRPGAGRGGSKGGRGRGGRQQQQQQRRRGNGAGRGSAPIGQQQQHQ